MKFKNLTHRPLIQGQGLDLNIIPKITTTLGEWRAGNEMERQNGGG